MKFSMIYLAIVTPLAAIIDWYDLPQKASHAICVALYTQPDAKVANGMYWAGVWWNVAKAAIEWLGA